MQSVGPVWLEFHSYSCPLLPIGSCLLTLYVNINFNWCSTNNIDARLHSLQCKKCLHFAIWYWCHHTRIKQRFHFLRKVIELSACLRNTAVEFPSELSRNLDNSPFLPPCRSKLSSTERRRPCDILSFADQYRKYLRLSRSVVKFQPTCTCLSVTFTYGVSKQEPIGSQVQEYECNSNRDGSQLLLPLGASDGRFWISFIFTPSRSHWLSAARSWCKFKFWNKKFNGSSSSDIMQPLSQAGEVLSIPCPSHQNGI